MLVSMNPNGVDYDLSCGRYRYTDCICFRRDENVSGNNNNGRKERGEKEEDTRKTKRKGEGVRQKVAGELPG